MSHLAIFMFSSHTHPIVILKAKSRKFAKNDAVIYKPSKRQKRHAEVQDKAAEVRVDHQPKPKGTIETTCSASQSIVKQPPLFVDANQTTYLAQPTTGSIPPVIYRGYYHSHSENSLDPPDLFF